MQWGTGAKAACTRAGVCVGGERATLHRTMSISLIGSLVRAFFCALPARPGAGAPFPFMALPTPAFCLGSDDPYS